MPENHKYYLVQADALPDVFLAVAETKRLLQTGEADTVGAAVKRTGISRSAYYKYRDSILPFENMMAGRILTLQFMLKDCAGILSGVLSAIAENGANILTINQSIPSGGCAMVTVSVSTTALEVSTEEFLRILSALDGVVRAEILAGG